MQSSNIFVTEPVNMQISVVNDTNELPKEHMFKAIHIEHRYSENTPSRHRLYETVEALVDATKNPNTCSYEVLDKPMRKIHLDLEQIEDNNHRDIVERIVKDFRKFIGQEVTYHITFNNGSKGHPGASYHVVFEAKSNYILQKNIALAFKHIHPEYANYIDESIYSVLRLFRLPNQCKQRDNDTPDTDDVHRIITPGTTEKDMVIQNIYTDIPEVTVNSLPDEAVREIGNIALENPRQVNRKGCSGNYARIELVETVAAQMTELKESNARLEQKIEQLEALNGKLFDYLTKLLENKGN